MGLFDSRVRNASLVSTRSTTTSLCVVLLRLVVMVFFRLVLPVLLYRIAYFCCGFEQVFYLVLFGMSLPGMSIGQWCWSCRMVVASRMGMRSCSMRRYWMSVPVQSVS